MNEEFANCTLNALRKVIKDLDAQEKTNVVPVVWIHDYQLLVAATTIRQVGANFLFKITFNNFVDFL